MRAARGVLAAFQPILGINRSSCAEVGRTIPIPTFPYSTIESICASALIHLTRLPTVLTLPSPFYIIGDIHGNVFDLARILLYTGLPPDTRLLFLGDYVDRGEFSVEVVTLLFSLMVLFPEHVYLLRGNHEFAGINRIYGFATEVQAEYRTRQLFDLVNEVFAWLPLVCVIDKVIFCVHGGISRYVSSLDDIQQVPRPIYDDDGQPLADLVWSDPSPDCETWGESSRGVGVHFGAKALENCLAVLGMRTLIRAHQCVAPGVSRFAQDRCYTVFSSSRYEGQGNRCGLLFIDRELHIECFSLPPLDLNRRATTLTKAFTEEDLLNRTRGLDSLDLKILELDEMGVKMSERRVMKWNASALSRSATVLGQTNEGPVQVSVRRTSHGGPSDLSVGGSLNRLPALPGTRVRRRTLPRAPSAPPTGSNLVDDLVRL
jgi:protein phosphatase